MAGGVPVSEVLDLDKGERVLVLAPITGAGDEGSESPAGVALGTAAGVVKRVVPDYPSNKDSFELINLKAGDEVVGAAVVDDDATVVFVTSDAQLLRFDAGQVRPQGRSAGGMAGIRLAKGAGVVFFGALPGPDADADAEGAVVATVAGSSSALPGTEAGTAKVTPLREYPAKGRGTGGVRCHRFLRGEDTLLVAWVGPGPARATAASGVAVDLPAPTGRRDGSGAPLPGPVAAIGR